MVEDIDLIGLLVRGEVLEDETLIDLDSSGDVMFDCKNDKSWKSERSSSLVIVERGSK